MKPTPSLGDSSEAQLRSMAYAHLVLPIDRHAMRWRYDHEAAQQPAESPYAIITRPEGIAYSQR